MCTENQLEIILKTISEKAKEVFGHTLHSVILYGSYARGDYDSESDIDILVLADVPLKDLNSYNRPFITVSSDLSLQYDIVVSVTLRDTDTFNRFVDALPFYRNVKRDGVKIA